jgi:hypothetical protein
VGFLVVFFCVANAVLANTPEVSSVDPTGGTRGSEIEINLRGQRLATPQELFIYEPGITVTKLEKVGEKNDHVKAVLKIAPDATLGEYHLRLRTSTGLSHLHTFWVGRLPIVGEVEPNSNFAQPQKIALNTTVQGVVTNEDVDYFAIEAKKGQLISVEVEAIRLGRSLFDPAVAILDRERFELAVSDDTPLLSQDCFTQAIAPEDGTYIVTMRETSFGGAGNFFYRLHIGDFPRPTAAYPAGGQAGQPLDVTFLGDKAGPIEAKVTAPTDVGSSGMMAVYPERDGRSAPSAQKLRVSPFANQLEAEPNAGFDKANVVASLPMALNGIIGETRDVDIYRVKLTKGQVIDVRVLARSLGSPLDPVLDLFDAAGKHLGGHDDIAGGHDSYMRFTVPADGDFHIHVRDQLLKGGEDYVYRVEVTPPAAKLALVIPEVARDDMQNRQWIAIPRGNRWMSLVQANRADFGGPLQLTAADLPQGVTMNPPVMKDNVAHVPVVFEAAADAPIAGKLIELSAHHTDPNVKIAGHYEQNLPLVRGTPNNTPYYTTRVEKIAVAVIDEAPFSVQLVEPKVPLLQSGVMNLKVVATKKAGWDEDIRVQLPFRPPGFNAQYEVMIPKGQTEVLYPVNAAGNAAVGDWPMAANSWASIGGGQVWVGSPVIKLTIAPYYFSGQIQMAATEQGKPVNLLVKLTKNGEFDGKAKLELVGLPNKVTSVPIEIAKDSAEATFAVTVDPTSPEGQHQSLFCQLSLVKDGEAIVQTLAGGGTLRIDKPRPAPVQVAESSKATTPSSPAPAAAPPKPLSRLEQLRLERQKQQAGGGE